MNWFLLRNYMENICYKLFSFVTVQEFEKYIIQNQKKSLDI